MRRRHRISTIERVVFMPFGTTTTPSVRLRVYEIAHRFADEFEVTIVPWVGESLLDRVRYVTRVILASLRPTALVLQKPFQPAWLVAILGTTCRGRVLVDIDDATWAHRGNEPAGAPSAQRRDVRLRGALQRATVVTVGSEHLQREVRKRYGCHARVVRTPVPARFTDAEGKAHCQRDPVVIGWLGMQGNMADFLAIPEVVRWIDADPHLVLRLISDDGPTLPLLGSAEFLRWDESRERELLQGLDIGIMPLRRDERSEGRCGYKAVQYSVCGLPVVASDVGASPEVVIDGETGFLVDDTDAWVQRLRELAESSSLRQELGDNGRRVAAQHFSTEACYAAYRAAVGELSSRPHLPSRRHRR